MLIEICWRGAQQRRVHLLTLRKAWPQLAKHEQYKQQPPASSPAATRQFVSQLMQTSSFSRPCSSQPPPVFSPGGEVNLHEDGKSAPAGVSDMNNTCEGWACTHCGMRTALCGTRGDRCHCVTADSWCTVRRPRPSGHSFTTAQTTFCATSVVPAETRAVQKVCASVLVYDTRFCGQISMCSQATCVLLCIQDKHPPFQFQTWLAALFSVSCVFFFPPFKDKHSSCSHWWPWSGTPATVGLPHKQWVKGREPGG